MSTIQMHILICDDCDTTFAGSGTLLWVKRLARKAGWITTGGGEFCCQACYDNWRA